MHKKPNSYKRTDVFYISFFLSLFITISEIKIINPYILECGKHKRSNNYKEEYLYKFGLKRRA